MLLVGAELFARTWKDRNDEANIYVSSPPPPPLPPTSQKTAKSFSIYNSRSTDTKVHNVLFRY